MSLKEGDMESARLKKTILEAFKEVLQKFHDTENKKILAIFILNGKLSQFKNEGFNLLDNFEYNLKFDHLSIDEIAVYLLDRIQGHVNLLTWKELFEFSYRMKEYTWPKVRRVVNNALRKPSQFITEDNVFAANSKEVLKELTIYHFKEALKEEQLQN